MTEIESMRGDVKSICQIHAREKLSDDAVIKIQNIFCSELVAILKDLELESEHS